MVLIIAKREAYAGIVSSTSKTEVLDNFNHRVRIPPNLVRKRWILKSFSFSNRDTTSKVRWVEVSIPQLMRNENVLYSLNQEGLTPLPRETFRFYPNKYSMDEYQDRIPTSAGCVSTPDLNLGVNTVNEGFLDIIITATESGSFNKIGLTSYELILECI